MVTGSGSRGETGATGAAGAAGAGLEAGAVLTTGVPSSLDSSSFMRRASMGIVMDESYRLNRRSPISADIRTEEEVFAS